MVPHLRRKAYDKLLKWKNESAGSSAILINGARRVGKSFLVEEFGKREYKDYVTINFTKLNPAVKAVFDGYDGDIDNFLQALSVAIGRVMPVRESLVIFDEVQLCPKARQMIKFLVEDGRYDYIETGSLLSIKANIKGIVIPSEEEDLNLYPLDFEEFLWAMGNETAIPYLRECLEDARPVGEELHRSLMGLFRKYMLVGGMPQAVKAFVESNSFEKAEAAKRKIIATYRKDITRYAEGYEQRVTGLFDSIPSELNRKERKFKITSLGKNAKNRDYEDSFLWLSDSMIVNPCVNATNPMVGLAMNNTSVSGQSQPSFSRSHAHRTFIYPCAKRVKMRFRSKEFILPDTAATDTPLLRKSSAIVSACLTETQKTTVRLFLTKSSHVLTIKVFRS